MKLTRKQQAELEAINCGFDKVEKLSKLSGIHPDQMAKYYPGYDIPDPVTPADPAKTFRFTSRQQVFENSRRIYQAGR